MRLIDADVIDYRNDRLHDQSADFIGGIVYANACVNETPTIETKQVKYFDEDENVWKIGNIIRQ